MVKAIFFDRDGVINDLVDYNGSFVAPKYLKDYRLKENSVEAFKLSKDNNFLRIIVTNQPDVVHGDMNIRELISIKNYIQEILNPDDIFMAMVRNSKFYKPNNGAVEYYIEKYNLNRQQSYFIGDRWKDIVCGYTSNLKTVFVGENYTSPDEYKHIKPNFYAKDILEACKIILEDCNDSIIC